MKLSYFELMTMIHSLAEHAEVETVEELCEYLQENKENQIELWKD